MDRARYLGEPYFGVILFFQYSLLINQLKLL